MSKAEGRVIKYLSSGGSIENLSFDEFMANLSTVLKEVKDAEVVSVSISGSKGSASASKGTANSFNLSGSPEILEELVTSLKKTFEAK